MVGPAHPHPHRRLQGPWKCIVGRSVCPSCCAWPPCQVRQRSVAAVTMHATHCEEGKVSFAPNIRVLPQKKNERDASTGGGKTARSHASSSSSSVYFSIAPDTESMTRFSRMRYMHWNWPLASKRCQWSPHKREQGQSPHCYNAHRRRATALTTTPPTGCG